MKNYLENHPKLVFVIVMVILLLAAGAPRGYGG